MKCLSLFLLFFSLPSLAIQWEIIGQDSKSPVYQGSFEADLNKSLGQTTVQILDENHIPYIGNEAGMNSILNTPTGDAAIVIVNDKNMRVYGWCYDVEGVIPSLMPDKFFFADQKAHLRWFFAFSSYENGEWKQYCVPAYTLPLSK